jgi:hypothetical protein
MRPAFQITSLFLYSSIKCITNSLLHSIPLCGTQTQSAMQRVHVQTGTTATRVVPLMRREKTAKWANSPLRITVSTFCNGRMIRGTVHTDTIRRYDTWIRNKSGPGFTLTHQNPFPDSWGNGLNTGNFLSYDRFGLPHVAYNASAIYWGKMGTSNINTTRT